jgi:aminopeptidase 2
MPFYTFRRIRYIADVNYDEKNDTIILNFAHTFTPENEILLDIDFQGELNDQMQGFYKSSYKDNQGNTQ